MGLKNLYIGDPIFRKKIKFLKALAFVPEHDLIYVYLELAYIFFDNDENFSDFLEYFEFTWISKDLAEQPYPSGLISLSWWNCHEMVLNSKPKTNNSIEAWNRIFNQQLENNPCLWRFIDVLKQEVPIINLNLSQIRVTKKENIRRDIKSKKTPNDSPKLRRI